MSNNVRQRVNNFLVKKMDAVNKFFGHKVYCYSKNNSGFLHSIWRDDKKRKWVTIKQPNTQTQPFVPKYIFINMPSNFILHYRVLYSPFQLWVCRLFGIKLKNKNRKLKKWR